MDRKIEIRRHHSNSWPLVESKKFLSLIELNQNKITIFSVWDVWKKIW